jgi:alkylhydroperoxidase family enzyme
MSETATAYRLAVADPERLLELDAEAPEVLRRHFDLIRQGVRRIPGVPPEAAEAGFETAPTLRALALKPQLFYSWFLTEYHSAKEGEVDSATKELLAVAVSKRTEQDETVLCTPYHGGAARLEGAGDDEVVIAEDFERRGHELPEEQRAVIAFGLKAAYSPTTVTDEDVEELRGLGLSDPALVEIVSTALIAYNLAVVNQVFDLRL